MRQRRRGRDLIAATAALVVTATRGIDVAAE